MLNIQEDSFDIPHWKSKVFKGLYCSLSLFNFDRIDNNQSNYSNWFFVGG